MSSLRHPMLEAVMTMVVDRGWLPSSLVFPLEVVELVGEVPADARRFRAEGCWHWDHAGC